MRISEDLRDEKEMDNKAFFTIVSGGTIYSPKLLRGRDIFIAGDRIALVDEHIDLPKNISANRIDARGRSRGLPLYFTQVTGPAEV